jgi:hypothetical protein
MVQRSGGSGAARTIEFVKNNYFHDAFFLKALGEYSFGVFGRDLTDECLCSPQWCVLWVVRADRGGRESISSESHSSALVCARADSHLLSAVWIELFWCLLQVHRPRPHRCSQSDSRSVSSPFFSHLI